MSEVTTRELRNRGGDVLERVERGEVLTVTRDGRPVARLSPVPRPPRRATVLLARWRALPSIESHRLRADLDDLLDPTL